MGNNWSQYLNLLIDVLGRISISFNNSESQVMDYSNGMPRIFEIFSTTKDKGKQLFFVGNGGSAAIASHMTADFMKNGGMKTYSLYDNAVATCMGNDYGYDYIFSKPLSFLMNENDLLVAISSSGKSQNIINAIKVAHEKKATVITFTGFKAENLVRTMGDANIYVPVESYGVVESIHNLILQHIVDVILERDGAII